MLVVMYPAARLYGGHFSAEANLCIVNSVMLLDLCRALNFIDITTVKV